MSFHGRNKHLQVKSKIQGHDKRSQRLREVAEHQAKVNEILERALRAWKTEAKV